MLQVCKYDFELACHHVVAQDKKAKKLESKIDKLTAGLGLRVEVEAMHETSHTWMPSTQSTRTHTPHAAMWRYSGQECRRVVELLL